MELANRGTDLAGDPLPVIVPALVYSDRWFTQRSDSASFVRTA